MHFFHPFLTMVKQLNKHQVNYLAKAFVKETRQKTFFKLLETNIIIYHFYKIPILEKKGRTYDYKRLKYPESRLEVIRQMEILTLLIFSMKIIQEGEEAILGIFLNLRYITKLVSNELFRK